MWLLSLTFGFPSQTGREEELKNIENGDVSGGRTGVSQKLPLRTPTQSPTKNIKKYHNHKKNHKTQKHKKSTKYQNPSSIVQSVPIFSANGAGVVKK